MSEAAQALGLKLKAEREKRGMSTQKMADDMHLDAWVIDALEAGDYERIGPAVYAKGHLKKYASILGVSPTEAASESAARPPGPLAPTPIIRLDPPGGTDWPKVGGFALIALVAGGIAWWRPWQRFPATPAAPLAASASAVAASAAAVPASAAAVAAASAPPLSAPADAASAPPAVTRVTSADLDAAAPTAAAPVALAPRPPSATPAELTPGVGRARLRLSFSADSRVDVYDYAGKPIFIGNGRANSIKTLAGIAPFRIYLGFASGVQLQVNDRAVAIGPQFVSGDVARFEAGADGVLRRDTRAPPASGTSAVPASPRG